MRWQFQGQLQLVYLPDKNHLKRSKLLKQFRYNRIFYLLPYLFFHKITQTARKQYKNAAQKMRRRDDQIKNSHMNQSTIAYQNTTMATRKGFPMKKFFLVAFYGLIVINIQVSTEKTGWLCDNAFYEDTPAVYFDGQEIINACISMQQGEINEHLKSCSLLPNRQCIASRYCNSFKYFNIFQL